MIVLAFFDLIVSAGLYAYVNVPTAVALTRNLSTYLRPGGEAFIGNMHPVNHSRWIMEYRLDWHLIYRPDAEMLAFAGEAAPHMRHRIVTEPAGVNPFVVVKNV